MDNNVEVGISEKGLRKERKKIGDVTKMKPIRVTVMQEPQAYTGSTNATMF